MYASIQVTRLALVYREVISTTAGPKAIAAKSTAYTRMVGTVGYTIGFENIQLRVDKIEHNNSSTGTMKLVLWAVDTYTGNTNWSGHRVAEVRLEQCSSNECYSNLKLNATRKSPPAGNYTLILSLEACIDGQFVMEDHRVFDKRVAFTLDAQLQGSCGFTIQGGNVELRAEKIDHNFVGATGTLKLILWASSQGAVNGNWTGYKVGKCKLEPLEAGYRYNNIKRTVSKMSVPSGSYYMILQLKSYTANGWISHDHLQFDGKSSL